MANPADSDEDEEEMVPEREISFGIREMRDRMTPLEIRKETRAAKGLWKEIPQLPEGFKPEDVIQNEDLSYDEEYFYMNPEDQYDMDVVQERTEAFIRPKPKTYAPAGWEHDIEAALREVRDGVKRRSVKKKKKKAGAGEGGEAGAEEDEDSRPEYDMSTWEEDEMVNEQLVGHGRFDTPMETTAFGTLVSVFNPRLLARRKMHQDTPFPDEYSDVEHLENSIMRRSARGSEDLAEIVRAKRERLKQLSLKLRLMMTEIPITPRALEPANFPETLDAGQQAAAYKGEDFRHEREHVDQPNLVDPRRSAREHLERAREMKGRLLGSLIVQQSRGDVAAVAERRAMSLPSRVVDGMLMFSEDAEALAEAETRLDAYLDVKEQAPKRPVSDSGLTFADEEDVPERDRLNSAFQRLLVNQLEADDAFAAGADADADAEDVTVSGMEEAESREVPAAEAREKAEKAASKDASKADRESESATGSRSRSRSRRGDDAALSGVVEPVFADGAAGPGETAETAEADFVVPGSGVVTPPTNRRVVGHRIHWDLYLERVEAGDKATVTREEVESLLQTFETTGDLPALLMPLVGESVVAGTMTEEDAEWFATEVAQRVIRACEAARIPLGDEFSEAILTGSLRYSLDDYTASLRALRERDAVREQFRRDREERLSVLATEGADVDAQRNWVENTPPEVLAQPKLAALIDPKAFVGVTESGALGEDPVGVFMSQLRDLRDVPEEDMQAALGTNMPSEDLFFGGLKVGEKLDLAEPEAAALARAHENLFNQVLSMKTPMQPRLRTVDARGAARAVGRRKRASATCTLAPGTGEFTVNGLPLAVYFGNISDRQGATLPLLVTNTAGVFDITCTAQGGGKSGQSGAIKLAVSRALQNFDPRLRPMLKKHGFLTRDARVKEEKKAGQLKARRKKQWNRR